MGFAQSVVVLVLASFVVGCLADCNHKNVYNVVDKGAKGDGETDDTDAFLDTWNAACKDSTAPTMLIPSGLTFLLNQIILKGPCNSNIHVQVDGNIVAPNKEWEKKAEHWITFSEINGLKIDGSGQVDGKGSAWWSCRGDKKCSKTPDAFFVLKCEDVQLSDLKFVNSPRKHLSLYNTVGAQISRLTITAPEDSPNTDGIHIQNSQNVKVFESTIGTGDDCISIGTGTSNINISEILCGPGHGISIGSLGEDDSEAKVEQIHVSNCRLSKTTNGVRIKTWQGGSGYAKRISFSNIFFDSVEKPIVINQYYCDDNDNCSNKTSSVQITDVYYNNMSGSSSEETAIILDCSETNACDGIVMENINIKSTKEGEGETTKASCFNAEVTIKGDVTPQLPCSSYS